MAAAVLVSEQLFPSISFLLHLARQYRGRLEFIGLYHTADQARSAEPAQRMLSLLRRWGEQQGLGFEIEATQGDGRPSDVRKAFLDWFGRRAAHHWVVNTTGGLKPMSLAAYEVTRGAVDVPDRRVVYLEITGQWFEWTNDEETGLLEAVPLSAAQDPDIPPANLIDSALTVEDVVRTQFPADVTVKVTPSREVADVLAVYRLAAADHWRWRSALRGSGVDAPNEGQAFEIWLAACLRELGLTVAHSVEVRAGTGALCETDLALLRGGRLTCIDIKLPDERSDDEGKQLAKFRMDVRQLGGSAAQAIVVRPGWHGDMSSAEKQAAALGIQLLTQKEMPRLFTGLANLIDRRLHLTPSLQALEAAMSAHQGFSVLSTFKGVSTELPDRAYPLSRALDFAMDHRERPWVLLDLGAGAWRLHLRRHQAEWGVGSAGEWWLLLGEVVDGLSSADRGAHARVEGNQGHQAVLSFNSATPRARLTVQIDEWIETIWCRRKGTPLRS